MRELETGKKNPLALSQALCLECGFCCNGVIFADVKLQPGDRLPSQKAGMQSVGKRLNQPCGFLNGRCCSIYESRPQYCRQFECALLKRVQAGEVTREAALKTIRSVQKKVRRIERLLEQLGDKGGLPLAKRFRRTLRALETRGAGDEEALASSELTMAMHELNHELGRTFHPGY